MDTLSGGFSLFGWWISLAVVICASLSMLYANPTHAKLQVWLQFIAYYARYWFLWLLVWSLGYYWLMPQAFYLGTALLAFLYLYMSWIEPNQLQIHKQTIILNSTPKATDIAMAQLPNSPLTLAVISDIHVGIFSHKAQLNRLVNRLNQLDVDAVVVAGDWLYHAGADIIGQLLIIKALNKPCFTVLSQADVAQIAHFTQFYQDNPYMPDSERLSHVFDTLGIQVLDDAGIVLKGVRLVGINETYRAMTAQTPNAIPNSAPTRASVTVSPNQPTLIISHDYKQVTANPHIITQLGAHTLVIAGQTHGGQIKLPWLTQKLMNATTGNGALHGLHTRTATPTLDNSKKKGLKKSQPLTQYQLWITTGIGMIGLPFRLNCAPCIDVLQITVATTAPLSS